LDFFGACFFFFFVAAGFFHGVLDKGGFFSKGTKKLLLFSGKIQNLFHGLKESRKFNVASRCDHPACGTYQLRLVA
jgi:hypothetical protein